MPTLAELLDRALHEQRAGQPERAWQSCQEVLQLQPDCAEAYYRLGEILCDRQAWGEAIAWYRQALACRPEFAAAYAALGLAWRRCGRWEEAVSCYEESLRQAPHEPGVWNNLAVTLRRQGKLDAAVAAFRRVLQLAPGMSEAHSNLGNALAEQGELDEALGCYAQCLTLQPDHRTAWENRLTALRCHPAVSIGDLRAAAAEYNRRLAAPWRSHWRPHANRRDAERPLRVGLISPRFVQHPVGCLLVGLLEQLDRQQFQAWCYADNPACDAWTRRMQAAAAQWQPCHSWSDAALDERIRNDCIDILFDLTGHAPGNRLPVFARKPAPLQISWIDAVGGTGLAAMDYVLADRHVLPEDRASLGERVLRMPDGHVCFDPPPDAPPPGPLPAAVTGRVTFGCFNAPRKLCEPVLRRWAEILQGLPESRLVLKYRGLDDPGTRRRLALRLEAAGIDGRRVEFHGPTPYAEHLAAYRQIDIALDPFPHNGGLTTCDALWMGVPVVTLPGEPFAARQSLSILRNVGLAETIAADPADYVQRAVALAADLPRLAALRADLRSQMAASPWCDAPRFARHWMALLRETWRAWVASDRPSA